MQIILLERVEKLGQIGDVVNVKPGYARNFLLPQKKALRASKDNITLFESQRAEIEGRNLEQRKEAEAVAAKVDGKSVILIRQAGESGQLYGSVTARDLADALQAADFNVERNQIRMDSGIKGLGMHNVRVMLHPEVEVTILANVARSEDEAETQAKMGRMVTAEEAREVAMLSDREKEVLTLVAQGLTNKEIAAKLRDGYGELANRIAFASPYPMSPLCSAEIIRELKSP